MKDNIMGTIQRQLCGIKAFLSKYYNLLILVLTPIILSPVVVVNDSSQFRTAYAIGIMAVYWVSEVTPLAVTSLLPLVLFPILGVLKGTEVCLVYLKDTTVTLLGGLLIALAIEQCNFHKRLALRVLLLVGVQPEKLMLGFMLVTGFCSMWIANTATTAMIAPIMEAVLKQLDMQYMRDGLEEIEEEKDEYEPNVLLPLLSNSANNHSGVLQIPDFDLEEVSNEIHKTEAMDDPIKLKQDARYRELCKALSLCVCYSANIGGTATLIGAGPQLVLAGQVEQIFPRGTNISFVSWFVFAFPQMLLFLFIGWIYLQIMFLDTKLMHLLFCFRLKYKNNSKGDKLYAFLQAQYEELGPLSWAEKSTLSMFIALVVLWFFRAPKFIPGWGDLFKEGYVTDGTTAIFIGFLLFQWPAQCPSIFNNSKSNSSSVNQDKLSKGTVIVSDTHKTLLDWKDVETKIPWNVLFLLGAGFALAKACDKSGLSNSLSNELTGLNAIPPMAVVFIICTVITFVTEITSNIATATMFLPVLASLGQSIEIHPFYLMIPATCCASFAFMLPVATAPNAIVFGTGRLGIRDMAKAGFGMNIIGILIVTFTMNTWGTAYYGLDQFPEWARYSSKRTTPASMVANAVANTTVATTKAFSSFLTSL